MTKYRVGGYTIYVIGALYDLCYTVKELRKDNNNAISEWRTLNKPGGNRNGKCTA